MAKNIVPAKEIKAWYLDPKTILWWHQVIAAPDVNNNKVFNNGISNGFKMTKCFGGQTAPKKYCDEPSRYQTVSLIRTLRSHKPVIPRRTFYFLSDKLSTKSHQFIMTDFHLCLIYQSYS